MANTSELRSEIRAIALPVILSNMAIVLFETVNVFWLGRLGRDVVAGIGAASFITWMIFSSTNLTSRGTTTFISQFFGKKELGECREVAKEGLVLSLLLSLVLLVVLLPLLPFLLDMMSLKGEVWQSAFDYLFIFTLGLPSIILFTVTGNIAIAYGDAKLSTRTLLVSLLINAILDPFLIFGWCGLPAMGVKGAAIAWIFAEIVGLALRLAILVKSGYLEISGWSKAFNFPRWASMVKMGWPPTASDMIFSMVYPLLTSYIVSFGSAPLAALNVCHRIEGIPYFICMGFSAAASTVIAQRIGAGQPEQAMRAYRMNLRSITLALILPSLAFVFIPGPLISLFINDPAVVAVGCDYLRIIGIFEVFLGWEIMTEGAFGGTGNTLPPMLIRMPLTLARIPLAAFLGGFLGMGTNGIWLALSLTTCLKGLAIVFWFLKGRWSRLKIIQSLS
ncbi:MAG TPA: hypothetical protein DD435_08670 [Cyanobacteria bacterium UBA8530]|nr:hypothetical protein [Cyanobacteria bacterium UBA8530]